MRWRFPLGRRRSARWGASSWAAAPLALAGLAYLGGVLAPLDRALADWRYRWPQRDPTGQLVLVAIDRESLSVLDRWPWPRGLHATLLERLFEAGCAAVAFDVDFSARSVPEEDAAFEAGLAEAGGRVILPVFQQWEEEAGGPRLVTTGPLPRFARHARLATINVRPFRDGLAREYRAHEASGGERLPAFAVALAPADLLPPERFEVDFSIRAERIPRLSYVEVLTGSFDPALVAGRRVVVGATALELGDQIAVPRYRALPGSLFQALAWESLVQGRAIQRPGTWFTLAVTLPLALLVMPLYRRAGWARGLLLVAGCGLGAVALATGVQALWAWSLDVTAWILACAGLYVAAVVRELEAQARALARERREARRLERLMRHVVENSFDGIVVLDGRGVVRAVNPAAEGLFGLDAAALVGRSLGSRLSLAGGLHDSLGPVEAEAVHASGKVFPVEVTVRPVDDEGRPLRVLFVRDITERKAQRLALEHQATHDALTDLPNRVLLARRLRENLASAWEDRSPLAVLILDLDRFKEINDTLGHPVGDLLLRAVAERLARLVRPEDTFARFGGDEFAVLLPATDAARARQVACRLVRALESPFTVEGLTLHVDASAGIALFPDHGSDAESLIPRADLAMYAAKQRRARVEIYDPAQDRTSVRQLRLTGALRGAMEAGEIGLVYQPKVAAASGRIVGVEALVRWSHRELGNVPPDEFIGLAERSGLIRPLTLFVLENALEQAARWHRRGMELEISVNISARNLLDEDLPALVEALLARRRLPAHRLGLEITESVIMEDPQEALEVLMQVAALGVGIAIDDFGTGYSSLAYLRRLPAREIKIDRSFVIEMDRNEDDVTIVRSTIELAHNLGLAVVAEGVETRRVWERLRALGCDYGQGYLFSRPLAPHALEGLLRRGSEPLPASAP